MTLSTITILLTSWMMNLNLNEFYRFSLRMTGSTLLVILFGVLDRLRLSVLLWMNPFL
ncbi:hypothetical protein SAMN04488688_108202 [Paenibacillus sp. cl141a]|nr:hypothetical protein SAMN04488688_108202 [Paenibacillus sp. cl141a]